LRKQFSRILSIYYYYYYYWSFPGLPFMGNNSILHLCMRIFRFIDTHTLIQRTVGGHVTRNWRGVIFWIEVLWIILSLLLIPYILLLFSILLLLLIIKHMHIALLPTLRAQQLKPNLDCWFSKTQSDNNRCMIVFFVIS